MQILSDVGYEDKTTKGLGVIHGEIKKFEKKNLIIPHMGWNSLKVKKPDKPIPPRVIWKMPIKTSKEEIHASEKLLYESFAFIGVGHGWRGLTLRIILGDNLKTDLS